MVDILGAVGGRTSLQKVYSHRWALLVGVNHYTDAAISNLRVCASDVQAIYDLLIANGYESDRMRLLIAPGDPDYPPTRAEILSALTSVAQVADESDMLLFYFSGHGVAHDGKAYILPADIRYTAIADTAINLNRVKQIIQESAARAKVIILDACHSGAQIGKAPPEMTEVFIRHVFEEAEGMAILASCKQKQVSWEWPEKGQSVFTHYLLAGLRGTADFDEKGFVTVGDIRRYVTNQVKIWAVQRSRVQTPTLQYTVVGDIVLMIHSSTTDLKPLENTLIITDKSNVDVTGFKEVGETSVEQSIEKPQITKLDVLRAVYKAYKLEPGEKINSDQVRRNLGLGLEQMNDVILALKERGFIEAVFVGDRALISITADGVAVLKE